MTAFFNPFAKRSRDGYPERVLRLKILTRELLNLDAETAVSVSEIACRDPECPGVETVIAVLREDGPRRLLRIRKPLPEVGRADIKAALLG